MVETMDKQQLQRRRDQINAELFSEMGRRPRARSMNDPMPTTPRWDELTKELEEITQQMNQPQNDSLFPRRIDYSRIAAEIEAEVEAELAREDDPCARLEPNDFDYDWRSDTEADAPFEFAYFCIECGVLTSNINGTHDICASCFYNPYDDGGYDATGSRY